MEPWQTSNLLDVQRRHPQITEVPLKGWFTVESLKVTDKIIVDLKGSGKPGLQSDV